MFHWAASRVLTVLPDVRATCVAAVPSCCRVPGPSQVRRLFLMSFVLDISHFLPSAFAGVVLCPLLQTLQRLACWLSFCFSCSRRYSEALASTRTGKRRMQRAISPEEVRLCCVLATRVGALVAASRRCASTVLTRTALRSVLQYVLVVGWLGAARLLYCSIHAKPLCLPLSLACLNTLSEHVGDGRAAAKQHICLLYASQHAHPAKPASHPW